MTGIHKLTLADLQKKFTAGEVSACDIVQAYTLRINQVEPKIKAYITRTEETAMAQAEALDEKLKGWRRTMPLTGMPVAIKDNICTEHVLTTCASRMLGNFVPPYDATVIARLRGQGYLLLGKTFQGFRLGPKAEFSVEEPIANSSRFVLPSSR